MSFIFCDRSNEQLICIKRWEKCHGTCSPVTLALLPELTTQEGEDKIKKCFEILHLCFCIVARRKKINLRYTNIRRYFLYVHPYIDNSCIVIKKKYTCAFIYIRGCGRSHDSLDRL